MWCDLYSVWDQVARVIWKATNICQHSWHRAMCNWEVGSSVLRHRVSQHAFCHHISMVTIISFDDETRKDTSLQNLIQIIHACSSGRVFLHDELSYVEMKKDVQAELKPAQLFQLSSKHHSLRKSPTYGA